MEKKFYKVTDMEEKPFTLVEITKTADGQTVKLAEHNSAADRVSFREVDSFNQSDFTGKVTEIGHAEYENALQDWGFDPSTQTDAGNAPAVPAGDTVGAGDGAAGNPTEGESSTSTPAAASGDAQVQSDAGSIESAAAESAAQNKLAAESGNPEEIAPATGEGVSENVDETAA